mmetsp:Transcript_11557/g.29535  ORF Transcript_11557/g.29535 Transcript_11557/m.29535 type:complete len:241 (-) Transcript_11557:122-844(-)
MMSAPNTSTSKCSSAACMKRDDGSSSQNDGASPRCGAYAKITTAPCCAASTIVRTSGSKLPSMYTMSAPTTTSYGPPPNGSPHLWARHVTAAAEGSGAAPAGKFLSTFTRSTCTIAGKSVSVTCAPRRASARPTVPLPAPSSITRRPRQSLSRAARYRMRTGDADHTPPPTQPVSSRSATSRQIVTGGSPSCTTKLPAHVHASIGGARGSSPAETAAALPPPAPVAASIRLQPCLPRSCT